MCEASCFSYWGFIHSFIEFHCKALNKTDIFPPLKDHKAPMGGNWIKQQPFG